MNAQTKPEFYVGRVMTIGTKDGDVEVEIVLAVDKTVVFRSLADGETCWEVSIDD